ncbi:hypothetical protein AYI68_g6012 [Smittium mucronatum]|uniref:Uncharacterized protein n=1 Tax=Smittium mucronatum TaxID=133383 RepID=A0A1R0GSM7_9FUNG|nr:hypothetical protein AYI68_g6012 [Smittium mucronatum]
MNKKKILTQVQPDFSFRDRYYPLTPPIYTLSIAPCNENTKFLYSPNGRNNRRESYRGLGSEFNESPSMEDTRYSMTGFSDKLNEGSKSSPSLRTPIEHEAEASLSLSSATSRQASTSGAYPYG